MTKKEIKSSTTQQLIERLVSNEGSIVARNGNRVKGILSETQNIVKELNDRNVIDYDTFMKNMQYE